MSDPHTIQDPDLRSVAEDDQRRDRRSQILRVIGLVAAAAALLVSFLAYRQVVHLREENAQAVTRAADAAQENQETARSISELCASGEVDKTTSRGKRVCDDASEDSTPKPAPEPVRGETGATGQRGPQGIPGADGQDGATGRPGRDGRDGTDGTDGTDGESIQGVPGSKGDPGRNGAAGSAGATGPIGPKGEDGADSKVPGPKGNPGRDGKSITGPRGPKGDKGDSVTGPKGERGPAGSDGKDGRDGRSITSAVCSATTGRWTITFSDDKTSDGGPCLSTTEDPTEAPTPTTDPEEDGTDE